MLFTNFARIALTACFAMAAAAIPAMPPEIRLPEWQNTRIDISEWKPEQKLLTLRVDIQATGVQLEKISAKLHLPAELGVNAGTHERPLLNRGDRVIFLHKFSVKPDFAGWAEIELTALPSQADLLALVKAQHAGEPAAAAILTAEVMNINQPLNFGRSLPLLVRDDIALCTAAETALKPDYRVQNRQFYLWYPEAGFGKGLTAEGLKTFAGALGTGNLKTAEAAGKMLIKKLESSKEPLMLAKNENESFSIPAAIACELLKADLVTIRAAGNKDAELLEKHIATMKPGYTRPFMMFNLASIYESLKKKEQARIWYEKALSELPAWPLAATRLKNLKK